MFKVWLHPRFKALRVIVRKELRETLRDRKAVLSVLTPAVIMPLMLIVGLLFLIKIISANVPNIGQPSQIQVANIKKMPLIESFLIEKNFSPIEFDGDWMAAQKFAANEPVIWLPPDIEEAFHRGEMSQIVLLYNAVKTSQSGDVNRLRMAINQLKDEFYQSRLLSAGLAGNELTPFNLQEFNVADERRMASLILGGFPTIILLIVFTVSLGFAVDLTSGEREKRTLESLLVAAPSSSAVVLGKYATLIATVLVANGLFYLTLLIGSHWIDFKSLGIPIEMSLNNWLLIAFIMLPIMLLAPAIQMWIGFSAKSFKEGQSLLSLLIMAPVLVNFYLLISQYAKPKGYEYMPILYQQLAVLDVLSGEPIEIRALLLQALFCIILVALFLGLAKRKLDDPKTLYS